MDQPVLPQRDAQFLTDTAEDGARRTLSHSRSPMIRLGSSANSYARVSSRIYHSRFGRSAMDWRLLVTLAQKPGATASEAVAIIGVDKAAISRALRALEAEGLVSSTTPVADERRRLWRLTEDGQAVHDAMLPVSLAMHHHLMSGFSRADIMQLNALLNRFAHNLDTLEDALSGPTQGPRP